MVSRRTFQYPYNFIPNRLLQSIYMLSQSSFGRGFSANFHYTGTVCFSRPVRSLKGSS